MLYRLARMGLFQLDAERAHDLAIEQLQRCHGTPLDLLYRQKLPHRPVDCMGITFRNPVGLAAGLDKNGECIAAFDAMGFGFVEVGTVTPKPQPGNDKPRLFRLVAAEGIINRMGFNNLGVDYLIDKLSKTQYDCVLGINTNRDTPIEKGVDDYLLCMEKVYPYAGYIAVNISSPNTPGLRELQYGQALDELLIKLKAKQAELAQVHNKYVPLALKIAPDLSNDELKSICDSLLKNRIDGVIATNTTLDRSLVEGMKFANEAGGLSGRPLQSRSTQVVRCLHQQLKDHIPIIGVGGIDSYMAAKEKMLAGAKLVQVYSGFIYHGPKLLSDIVKHI